MQDSQGISQGQQQTPSQLAQQTPDATSFAIPQEYADRGWVKEGKIKSVDDMFKAYDNAQSLLGKRPAGVPQPDAPDEEWDKFYAAAGRPEKPEYNLPDIEGIPKGVDLAPFKQKAMPILHAAGLNQKQAEKVWKEYLNSELAAVGETKSRMAELDAAFDKMAKETFGDKFDAASEVAQKFLNTSVDEKLRFVIAEADPKTQLAVISAIAKAQEQIDVVKKQYGAEGSITSGEAANSVDINSTRKELAELRTSQAAKDFTHKDHKETIRKIGELAGRVQVYYKNNKAS